jgi:hypothetical protein
VFLQQRVEIPLRHFRSRARVAVGVEFAGHGLRELALIPREILAWRWRDFIQSGEDALAEDVVRPLEGRALLRGEMVVGQFEGIAPAAEGGRRRDSSINCLLGGGGGDVQRPTFAYWGCGGRKALLPTPCYTEMRDVKQSFKNQSRPRNLD